MISGKSIDDHLFARRYFYLLVATILQVFLVSFFPSGANTLINEISFSLFILANINFIRHNKRIIIAMIIFALIVILLIWLPDESHTGYRVKVAQRIAGIIFISVIIYIILLQIIKSRVVNLNMILGVITIYILFGLITGECNQLIYYFDPHAFTGELDPDNLADLRYFSYVTITTVGYGDITPVSGLARATAVFFSLTGQIYLAVVIAVIVGKYVSHSNKNHLL